MDAKTVLVTGASSGLGADIASHLASIGYRRIALVARSQDSLEATAEECRKNGATDVFVLARDLSKVQDCIDAIEKTVEHYGDLHIVISCAGMQSPPKAVRDITLEEFHACSDLNYRATFLLTKHALPHLEKTKGCILFISSVLGSIVCREVSNYCSSKAAMNHFVRCVAVEEAENGIRINTLSPGSFVTPMHTRQKGIPFDEEAKKKIRESTREWCPMRRSGEPHELSKMVAFLVSDDNLFMTGANIVVDGGLALECKVVE